MTTEKLVRPQSTKRSAESEKKDYFTLKTHDKQHLRCWMTSLSEPRDNFVKVAFNAKFPRQPSYQNPLEGILHHKMDISFNFVMRDDTTSQYPCTDL